MFITKGDKEKTVSLFGLPERLVARSLRTRLSPLQLDQELVTALKVRSQESDPVGNWTGEAGVKPCRNHKRSTGKTVSAGVVRSRAGAVRKSRVSLIGHAVSHGVRQIGSAQKKTRGGGKV